MHSSVKLIWIENDNFNFHYYYLKPRSLVIVIVFGITKIVAIIITTMANNKKLEAKKVSNANKYVHCALRLSNATNFTILPLTLNCEI